MIFWAWASVLLGLPARLHREGQVRYGGTQGSQAGCRRPTLPQEPDAIHQHLQPTRLKHIPGAGVRSGALGIHW